MPGQNFGKGVPPPQKKIGAKIAKFGPISDDIKIRQRISPKRIKIFKIGQVHFVPIPFVLSRGSLVRLSGEIVPTEIECLEDPIGLWQLGSIGLWAAFSIGPRRALAIGQHWPWP